MAYYQEFLDTYTGKGVGLSTLFDSVKGTTDIKSGVEKINNSIHMILSTRVGERVNEPEFGSKLYKALFEPNDMVAQDLIEVYVTDALDKWEKRITVTNIVVGSVDDDNVVPITIYYKFKSVNIEGCYVYPFCLDMEDKIQSYTTGEYT